MSVHQISVEVTPELDAVLDGMGKLFVSIISSYARKYSNFADDVDDIFQDFCMFYLEKKDKYDETKGKRTTFVVLLFRTFMFRRYRKNRILSKNITADAVTFGVEYDADEIALIEAFEEGRTRHVEVLAKRVGKLPRLVTETLEGLQSKVERKQRHQVIVHN